MDAGEEHAPRVEEQETKLPQGPAKPPPLRLEVAELTHVGQVRPHNEDFVDSYMPPDPGQLAKKGSLFLVADGMGGHQAGEVASRGAVELAIGEYYSDTDNGPGKSLVRAIHTANRQYWEQAQTDASRGGMGTTLVAAVILGRQVSVANVGDSRAYILKRGAMSQITEDHSWVEEQVRLGMLEADEARHHPQRNLVTRALGSKPAVDVDLFEGEIEPGDTLILCSDGLTGFVTDQEIASIVRDQPPEQAAERLVALANERGGSDNITVLIVSAQEEAVTVRAPVLVRPETKILGRVPLVPALAGGAALLVLGVVGWWLVANLVLKPKPAPSVTPEVTPVTVKNPGSPTLAPTVTLASGAATLTPAPAAYRHTSPILIRPMSGETVAGSVLLEWSHGMRLAANETFEIRIWPEGQPGETVALECQADCRTGQRRTVNLREEVPKIAAGTGSQYLWTVVVIEGATRAQLSPEPLPRSFTLSGS